MEPEPWTEYAFEVVIRKHKAGQAECEIKIRLRNAGWFVVSRHFWLSGAPTPAQLELLQAAVEDELQTHILAVCGVQGVLLPDEDS